MRHCIALLAIAAIVAGAQTRPTIEVTSVKANTSTDFRGAQMQFLPGGRFVATNYPLQFVIPTAWNLPFQGPRLSGGPEWLRSERFDIEAKAANGAVRHAEMRLMMRALLEDRFKLKMRRETKELPIFAVIVGKNGPNLEKSTIEEKDCETAPCHVFLGGRGRGLHGQAVDMRDLAMYMENWAERPVVDMTGILGLFHIETRGWLAMTPGPAPAAGAKAEDGGDLADGLKLEARKAAVDVFHIDSIEKPSQN